MKLKEQLIIEATDPRWLSSEQIGGLSSEQIGWLSRSQIGGLSREQKSAIEAFKNVPILKNPYTSILAAIQRGGKIEMSTWHSCETTHCLGGWTVTLAPGGIEFEKRLNNTAIAAEEILRASRPDAPLPYFYASNEAAMAFIEARAAEEKE